MLFAATLLLALAPADAATIAQRPEPGLEIIQEGGRRGREDATPRTRRGDQDFASRAVRAGEIRSLAEIEAHIVPRMRGARYLGSTFDRDTAVYTLKFMGEAAVIWVEVDGRSGRVIR